MSAIIGIIVGAIRRRIIRIICRVIGIKYTEE